MKAAVLWLLALGYVAAGVLHFVYPDALIAITPNWVPDPAVVIAATGIAESAGAMALVQPWSPGLRRAGGIGLALYALCVFPANIQPYADRHGAAAAATRLGLSYPAIAAAAAADLAGAMDQHGRAEGAAPWRQKLTRCNNLTLPAHPPQAVSD